MANLTEDQKGPEIVHETASAQFYINPLGCVSARAKATGNSLPSTEIQLLLLLDIAQSLTDIRLWGIAQHNDGGQRTYDVR